MNCKFYAGVLLIFARAPRLGQVKSRLARSIGEHRATGLYCAMLRDTLARARSLETQANLLPVVAFTPHDAFESTPSLEEFWTGARVAQIESDLGAKMSAASAWAFENGAQSVLLIGTDAPDLPAYLIEQAVTSLQNFDAVTIPARDGGFVLWGAHHDSSEIFAGIDWTQNQTLMPVLANAARLNWRVRQLTTWSDVDEWDDVRALWTRLKNQQSVAPHAWRWLSENGDLLNDN